MAQKTADINIVRSSTVKGGLGERRRRYNEAKYNKGKIGFQLGVKRIDNHLGGLRDEMLIIMGVVGVGKTYLALMFTVNIWLEHKVPVVIITNELSDDAIKGRIDSIVGGFSYSKYRKGKLDESDELTLESLNEIYSDLPELHVISGAGKSVAEIEYEMLAIKPAMFMVDGLYLTDMGYNDQFKNTMEASRAYQRLIKKHKLPAILTTQMMEGNQTKYARAIQEDADIVLKLFRSQAMIEEDKMELGFTKIREEDPNISAWLNWDFVNSNFSETDWESRDEMYEEGYTA